MKILAFSDTHLNKKAINNLIDNSKKVDILICAGDISWFGVSLEKILQMLDSKIKKLLYKTNNLLNIIELLKTIKFNKSILKIIKISKVIILLFVSKYNYFKLSYCIMRII